MAPPLGPKNPALVAEIQRLRTLRMPMKEVARILKCSTRTIWRYSKGMCPLEESLTRPDPERIALARTYYFCRWRQADIAEHFEVSRRTVIRWTEGMTRLQRRPGSRRIQRSPLDPLRVHEWRRRRLAGEAVSRIADEDGSCKVTVGRYTWDIAVEANRNTYDRAAILRLIEDDLPSTVIAKRIGCTNQLVSHYRKKLAA